MFLLTEFVNTLNKIDVKDTEAVIRCVLDGMSASVDDSKFSEDEKKDMISIILTKLIECKQHTDNTQTYFYIIGSLIETCNEKNEQLNMDANRVSNTALYTMLNQINVQNIDELIRIIEKCVSRVYGIDCFSKFKWKHKILDLATVKLIICRLYGNPTNIQNEIIDCILQTIKKRKEETSNYRYIYRRMKSFIVSS